MRHGSLFSGIGGFDLAAEWMGWENIFHCEWMPFPRQVLHHHFPNSISYEDITKTDFTIHRGSIDILTGGFPCQPYSQAGKRLGKEDERHLWPHMFRAIQEINPTYVVGENVRGLTHWNGGLVFEEVCADLENCGYEVQPILLAAASVGAPHRRDRVWFVASNTNIDGRNKQERYDCGCQNANGCYCEEFRSADSSNVDRCDSYGDVKRESKFNHRTCIQRICQKNKTSKPNGICELDKINNKCKGIIEKNKCEFNESRALVSDGHNGIQLSNNRGLEFNKNSLSSSNGIESKNDTPRIKGMDRNATNTSGIRYESRKKRKSTKKKSQSDNQQPERFNEFYRTNFEMFPSQSPICGGNDGLPTELDGITFSKWRQESIKGYGNAIVPQVAYEIFKVIQQLDGNTIPR